MKTSEVRKEQEKDEKEAGCEKLLVLPADYLTFTPRERKTWIARKRVDPEMADAIRRAFC